MDLLYLFEIYASIYELEKDALGCEIMNKQEFIKMIKPFTTPEMQTIMGEGLEIVNIPWGHLDIENKLLFIDNQYLVYSTDKEHYLFKFKDWHNISSGSIPFNPNMKWGDGEGELVEMLHLRPYPLNKMNYGKGWRCDNYQIIPKNYLLEYFGIESRFMNWKTNPWDVKS